MDREIFVWGGRKFDPLAVYRRLLAACRERDVTLEGLQSIVEIGQRDDATPQDEADAHEALGVIAKVYAAAFGFKLLEDDQDAGLTEQEVMDAGAVYMAFVSDLKGKRSPSPSAA